MHVTLLTNYKKSTERLACSSFPSLGECIHTTDMGKVGEYH